MSANEERDTKQALVRGFLLKCPACGKGDALHKYLQIKPTCDHCGLELGHARTDDGPAYFTLSLVVAIVFPLFAVIYANFSPEPWVVAVGMMLLAFILAIVLLPRIKGMFVGLQWATRLHGF